MTALSSTNTTRTGVVTAARFAASALATGVLGGAVTAGLAVVYAEFGTPLGRVLTFAVPAVLAPALVRLPPRVAAVATAAGVALLFVTLGRPGLGDYAAAPAHNAGVTLLVLLLGAMSGLAPAAALILTGIPALLVLPARASLPVVTALAVTVTAAFALWVTADLGAAPVTGIAAVLAGAGVALTSGRWRAADRANRTTVPAAA